MTFYQQVGGSYGERTRIVVLAINEDTRVRVVLTNPILCLYLLSRKDVANRSYNAGIRYQNL